MAIVFPLGNDDFSEVRDNGNYYIDKTDFIHELLSKQFKANLITRPRRFGKTLTMSMLEDFFDINRDSKKHFADLAISKNVDIYENWINQWPVLFLTLKSVEGNDFSSAYGLLKELISDLCITHNYLEDSDEVNTADKGRYRRLRDGVASDAEVKGCLYALMRMMTAYYGKQVILLIDEYDVPLAKASEGGYYSQMLDVIHSLLGKVLKTNRFLKFAVVTGCLRIAKESIFAGTNNFVSDTITDNRFNEYIGFTQNDVQKILTDTGFTEHMEEISIWYDGYRFGNIEVYCPWDVLNHAAALQENPHAEPNCYWENTSHNAIIRRFIDREDLWKEEHINDDFETLLDGGYIKKAITENLTYDMLHSSADNLWSLLYLTGYLTKVSPGELHEENIMQETKEVALRIPNEEIRRLFRSTVTEWFKAKVKSTDRSELFDALWNGDEQECTRLLSQMVFETISFHDYKEDFYHAFVTGILSFAGYKVVSSRIPRSKLRGIRPSRHSPNAGEKHSCAWLNARGNKEQGEGRSDILLLDERGAKVIVIEVKHSSTLKGQAKKCDEALQQIRTKRYAESLEEEYDEIMLYGISFFKKRCEVKTEKYK